MRRLSLLPLLTSSLLAVEPRISQISPSVSCFSKTPQLLDLDGDGDLDLAFTSDQEQGGFITWIEKTGPRDYRSPQVFSYRPGAGPEGFTDYNGDGKIEYLKFSLQQDGLYQARLNNSLVSARPSEFVSAGELRGLMPHFVSLEQDSEAQQIIIEPNLSSDTFQIFTLTPQGNLTHWSSQVLKLPSLGSSQIESTRSADFDNDGDLDLVILTDTSTYLFERTAANEFTFSTGMDSRHDSIVDLNGDGSLDLVNFKTLKALTVINFEGVIITDFSFPAIPDNLKPVSSPKITLNSSLLVSKIESNETILAEYRYDSSTLNWIESFRQRLPDRSTIALSTDWDGDGKRDYLSLPSKVVFPRSIIPGIDFISPVNLIEHPTCNTLFSARWQDDSSWNTETDPTRDFYINANKPIIGDFDNDQDDDIIIGPDTEKRYHLLLNDGTGSFTSEILNLQPGGNDFETLDITNVLAVDFDDDGNLDLSVTFQSNQAGPTPRAACRIIKGLGNGSFETPELVRGDLDFVVSGFCGITEFVDWDGDDDLDAILEGGWRENLAGELSSTFRPLIGNITGMDALGNSVTLNGHIIGDFDGDGFLDYVAAAYEESEGDFTLGLGRGLTPPTDLAIAYSDLSGAITNISILIQANLYKSDALGNPFLFPPSVLDLNLDGRDELILPSIGSDALGNSIVDRMRELRLSTTAPRDLNTGLLLDLPEKGFPKSDKLVDFDGDERLEYASATRFIRPTPSGPEISELYDFLGDFFQPLPIVIAQRNDSVGLADFDQDGDLDALYSDGFGNLSLARNLIVDERSPITQALVLRDLSPQQATPLSDPDGDGLTNEQEFLLGTDPLIPDAAQARDLNLQWDSSESGLALSFQRRTDAAEFKLEYRIERSADLSNWEPISINEAIITPDLAPWESVSFEGLSDKNTYFYRTSPIHNP